MGSGFGFFVLVLVLGLGLPAHFFQGRFHAVGALGRGGDEAAQAGDHVDGAECGEIVLPRHGVDHQALEAADQFVKFALALVVVGVGKVGDAGRDVRLLHQPRSGLTRAVPGVARQPRRIGQGAAGGYVPREGFLTVREGWERA